MSDSPEPSSVPPAAGHGSAQAPAADGSPVGVTVLVLVGSIVAFVALTLRGPGESGAVASSAKTVSAALRRINKPAKVHEVERACEQADCECVAVTARHGVDVETKAVLTMLANAGARCDSQPEVPGLRAEALVRDERDADGKLAAEQVLAKNPKDPYALYAVALADHRAGRRVQALRTIQDSIDNGRGGTAHLLRGLILFSVNQLDQAKAAFSAILTLEPGDIDALYNVAVVAHRQRRFHEAREAYVKVMRTDPAHKNARYNLAILAHSIGASDEAQHHLRKFEQIVPANEPLIARLKAILAVPPEVPEAPRMGMPPIPSPIPPGSARALPSQPAMLPGARPAAAPLALPPRPAPAMPRPVAPVPAAPAAAPAPKPQAPPPAAAAPPAAPAPVPAPAPASPPVAPPAAPAPVAP